MKKKVKEMLANTYKSFEIKTVHYLPQGSVPTVSKIEADFLYRKHYGVRTAEIAALSVQATPAERLGYQMACDIQDRIDIVNRMHINAVGKANDKVNGKEIAVAECCVDFTNWAETASIFAQNQLAILARNVHLADTSIGGYISKVNVVNCAAAYCASLKKAGFFNVAAAHDCAVARSHFHKEAEALSAILEVLREEARTYVKKATEVTEELDIPLLTFGFWTGDGNDKAYYGDNDKGMFSSFAEMEEYCKAHQRQGAVRVDQKQIGRIVQVIANCTDNTPISTLYEVFMALECVKRSHGEPIIDADKKFTLLSMVTKFEFEAAKKIKLLSKAEQEVVVTEEKEGGLVAQLNASIDGNKLTKKELTQTSIKRNEYNTITSVLVYDSMQQCKLPLVKKLLDFGKELAEYDGDWKLPVSCYKRICEIWGKVSDKISDSRYLQQTLDDIKNVWQHVSATFKVPAAIAKTLSAEDLKNKEKAEQRAKQTVFSALTYVLRKLLKQIEEKVELTLEERAMLMFGSLLQKCDGKTLYFSTYEQVEWHKISKCTAYLLPSEYFLWCVNIAVEEDGIEPIVEDQVTFGPELQAAAEEDFDEMAADINEERFFFEEGKCWQEDDDEKYILLQGTKNLNGWATIVYHDDKLFARNKIEDFVTVPDIEQTAPVMVLKIDVTVSNGNEAKKEVNEKRRYLQGFDRLIVTQGGFISGQNDPAEVPVQIPGLQNKICTFGETAQKATGTDKKGKGYSGTVSLMRTVSVPTGEDKSMKHYILAVLENVTRYPGEPTA